MTENKISSLSEVDFKNWSKEKVIEVLINDLKIPEDMVYFIYDVQTGVIDIEKSREEGIIY